MDVKENKFTQSRLKHRLNCKDLCVCSNNKLRFVWFLTYSTGFLPLELLSKEVEGQEMHSSIPNLTEGNRVRTTLVFM